MSLSPSSAQPTLNLGATLSPMDVYTHSLAALQPSPRSSFHLPAEARARVTAAEQRVAAILASGRTTYGVTSGVGSFHGTRVADNQLAEFQRNILRSHSCGVGELLPRDVVMAMWILRLVTLAQGYSGIRLSTVEYILRLLEAGVLAEVPSRGSVGASGDLCPAAHAALPLLGEGWCTIPSGQGFARLPAMDALRRLGLVPLELAAKEALSLINGTGLSTALAINVWAQGRQLVETANLASALAFVALELSLEPLHPQLLSLHRHAGTAQCGSGIAGWLGLKADNDTRPFERVDDGRQAPYSVRCAPQVHGAVFEELRDAERVLLEECNAVTDNPLLLPGTEDGTSGGNFHAIYVARASDRMASALATLALISERRISQLMNGERHGLPPFLTRRGGLHSGLMMAQVTAAALASECKTRCFPASVDSISTNNDQEDHVSMGPAAGFRALEVVGHCRLVLAIELFAASQALDLRGSELLPAPLRKVHALLREDAAPVESDRPLADDFERIAQSILQGRYAAGR